MESIETELWSNQQNVGRGGKTEVQDTKQAQDFLDLMLHGSKRFTRPGKQHKC